MPKLVFTKQSLQRDGYELILEKTTVGRGDQNTLVIHDPSLSAAHCEILLNGNEVIVRDMESRNGTFVNGTRLQGQQAQLKHGQTVRFGSVEARLELDDEDEDTTATDVTAVHAYGKAIRDQRRAEQHPKPTDPSHHVGDASSDGPDEKTVSVTTRLEKKQTSTPTQPPAPEPARRGGLVGVAVVLVVIVVIALLWKFLGRS